MTGPADAVDQRPEPGDVDLLTLNLWAANGPAEARLTALADHLEAHRPHVLVLQEVAGDGKQTQAHVLARRLGYDDVAHTRSGRTRLRGEGLAIVSDLEVGATRTLRLPSSLTDHPRAAQIADLSHRGSTVRVVNTHLAWRLGAGALRTLQMRAIAGELDGWDGPMVVAGDLNDVGGSDALRVLTDPSDGTPPFTDGCAAASGADRPTFDRANPYLEQPELAGRRVDHVLVRGLDVRSARVILDGEAGPIVSDHFGVWVRLALGPVGTDRA